MKKIIVLIVAFLGLIQFGSVYAQSIRLDVPNKNIDINNPFSIAITVSDAPEGGEVTIEGIDQFTVVGQSTARTMQVINGVREQGTQLQLQLKANDNGIYTLGPARISGNNSIESNSVQVEVIGEKLFVNGTPQGRQTKNAASQESKKESDKENPSRGVPLRFPIIVFLLLGIGGVLATLRKRKQFEKVLNKSIEEHTDDGFIELGTLPESADEQYYQKTLLRISTWITLQTGYESVGSSPESLKDTWKEHGYHGADSEPIIEILGLIQEGLYQGNQTQKETLHSLLHSL